MKKEDDLSENLVENTDEVIQETTIEDEILKLSEENQKLKDEFLRALAESENVKKRCAAEIEKNNKGNVSITLHQIHSYDGDNIRYNTLALRDFPSRKEEEKKESNDQL